MDMKEKIIINSRYGQVSQNVMCPYCKEIAGRKVGMYATVKDGKKQRFQCKECGRTWY